jgi:hypothetical protein
MGFVFHLLFRSHYHLPFIVLTSRFDLPIDDLDY